MPKRHLLLLLAGILAYVVAACGGGEDGAEASDTTAAPITTTSETTAAPFTRQAPEAVLLSLTWEDETCAYEGPTELTAGEVELVYVNGSEDAGYVNFLMLTEGKTFEDAYERSEWPTNMHAPTWTRGLNTWGPVPAGMTVSWVRDLEAGSYFMVCARTQPVLFVWWGTGLTVEG